MHDFALEIFFFAQRFHNQLLQIFGKQRQSVLVWNDHHIFVSFVPPDLETTTTSVWGRRSSSLSKTRSNPSGSVLSKKKMSIGSRADPSASATSCGPSAEPPIPISSTCLNRSPFSAAIFPA